MHLSNLINDILDAAAAGKGKLAIKLEKVGIRIGQSLRSGVICPEFDSSLRSPRG